MVKCTECNYKFEGIENQRQACPKCGSRNRVIQLSTRITQSSLTSDNVKLTLSSAPPLSFGAIVNAEKDAPDDQIIKLVDPIYTELIKAIEKNPELVYQINHNQWEEIIAAAYDKAGFDEVKLMYRSADVGRNVIAIKKGFGSIKFIEQVKAYNPGYLIRADEVRALLGVLNAEQDTSKAIFTTTSNFAAGIEEDRLIKPFLPTRLELIDREKLLQRLIRKS